MQLKLSEIKLTKNYSRCHGVGDVSELMESLDEHGQLMPVLVDPENELVAGFRRYSAAKKLGWTEIWAELTLKTPAVVNLVENLCRKDLSLWEEIQGLRDAFGENPNVSLICRETSKSRNWVQPRVDAWKLPQEYLDKIQLKQVDIGDLRGRLYSRQKPSPTSRYIGRPTENEIRDAISRLTEQGRTDEARALAFSLGTITYEDLVGLPSD